MNIVAILGSPINKGNSNTIAMSFVNKAQELGAETSVFHLNDLEFKGCQSCSACKNKRESCILKDDLTPVLEAIHAADVVVMGSPIYYWDVTGPFKMFIDRTYSFLRPDFFNRPDPCRLQAGKKGLLVLTQGAEEEKHRDVPQKYDHFMEFYGMNNRRIIRAANLHGPTTAEEKRPYVEQAQALAQEWCGR